MLQEKKDNKKYHFRYYRVSKGHPFLVVLVTESKNKKGKIVYSGFNMTHSVIAVLKNPHNYIKLSINPNPQDDCDSYLKTTLIREKAAQLFSSPIEGWELSNEDEKTIDDLIKKKYPEIAKEKGD